MSWTTTGTGTESVFPGLGGVVTGDSPGVDTGSDGVTTGAQSPSDDITVNACALFSASPYDSVHTASDAAVLAASAAVPVVCAPGEAGQGYAAARPTRPRRRIRPSARPLPAQRCSASIRIDICGS